MGNWFDPFGSNGGGGGGGGDMTNYYTKAETNELLNEKQDTLEFDSTPTLGSENAVISDGIAKALNEKQDILEYDSVPTYYSDKVMTSGAIANALVSKMNVEVRDQTPTAGSSKIVVSGGVYQEFQRVNNEQIVQNDAISFLANRTVKNIINTDLTSRTHRGITYTLANDRKINMSGTLDSNYDYSQCWLIGGVPGQTNDIPYSAQVPIPKGKYALTLHGGSSTTYYAVLGYRNMETGNRIYKQVSDGETTFEILYDTGRYDLAIYCVSKEENFNATADLMLRPLSIGDSSYQPYAPSNRELADAIEEKQNVLTFDSAPTSGSSNPATSGGIKTYVDEQVATKASLTDVFGTGTLIESYTDLDSLTSAGIYTCSTVTIANTLVNIPVSGSAFRLEVKYLNNSTRLRQECYILSDTSTYYARTYTSTGWKPWILYQNAKEGAYGQGSAITATNEEPFDLNSLQSVGRYYYGAAAAPYIQNMPTDIPTAMGGEIIVEAIQLTNRFRQTIYLNSSNNVSKYWVRHAYSGTTPDLSWSNWVLFESSEKNNAILTPISESEYEALTTKDQPLYFIYD